MASLARATETGALGGQGVAQGALAYWQRELGASGRPGSVAHDAAAMPCPRRQHCAALSTAWSSHSGLQGSHTPFGPSPRRRGGPS